MNNLIGIVAAMAMVFSKHVTSYELLIIGRYLIGVNCGLNTSLVPMYISEIAPLNLRGGLGTVNQLAVTVGLLNKPGAGRRLLAGHRRGLALSTRHCSLPKYPPDGPSAHMP